MQHPERCSRAIVPCRWVAALRLYVRLAQEEARLCAAVFPPSEQAAVLAQVGWHAPTCGDHACMAACCSTCLPLSRPSTSLPHFPCTLQVAASGASSLMDSADVVLAARRAPEKMFGLLDMHDAAAAALAPLRATLAGGPARPDRVSSGGAEPLAVVAQLSQVGQGRVFQGWGRAQDMLASLCRSTRPTVPSLVLPPPPPTQLRARLAAEVRACFAGLQESVGREAARGVPADGTVHPLCAGTLAALKRLLACESALPVLFADGAWRRMQGFVMSMERGRRLLTVLPRMTAAAPACSRPPYPYCSYTPQGSWRRRAGRGGAAA